MSQSLLFYLDGRYETQFRIIDPNSTFKPGTIASNQIYLNQNGQKLKYQSGKWEVWK